MSFIGRNIKKIRTTKGLSQTEFGKLFGITRGSIGSYEEGRAEPKIETLKTIANKFSISLDAIITAELTVNQLSGFNPDKLLGNNSFASSENGLPSVLPKSLIDKHGDLTLISGNTFFKTSLNSKADFSLTFDDSIKLDGVSATKGDVLFCKKAYGKSPFGFLLLKEGKLYWQVQEPDFIEGVFFKVVGLLSSSFMIENKNPLQQKLSELELRIINLEAKS
jgi:transcriptional regulator with XRE-family HTH domain